MRVTDIAIALIHRLVAPRDAYASSTDDTYEAREVAGWTCDADGEDDAMPLRLPVRPNVAAPARRAA